MPVSPSTMENGLERSIKLASQPFDVAFHPGDDSDIVAAGLISGSLELFNYKAEEPKRLWKVKAHKNSSCRAVRFTEDGQYHAPSARRDILSPDWQERACGADIFTASSDCSLRVTDVNSGAEAHRIKNAHSAAINRLLVTGDTVASGDDAGTVKLWDRRQAESTHTFSSHTDFVGDLTVTPTASHLLSVSGDGTLVVYDLRMKKVEKVSEYSEEELLSVCIMKHKHKVVCGSQGGVLLLYSWNHFEDCSDRFPGHLESIDSLIKVDEDTLITGSNDGIIRIVSILPTKMLGVVGTHADSPIQALALSRDGLALASVAQDRSMKIWDLGFLKEEEGEEDEEGEEGEKEGEEKERTEGGSVTVEGGSEGEAKGKRKKQRKGKGGGSLAPNNFYSSL